MSLYSKRYIYPTKEGTSHPQRLIKPLYSLSYDPGALCVSSSPPRAESWSAGLASGHLLYATVGGRCGRRHLLFVNMNNMNLDG